MWYQLYQWHIMIIMSYCLIVKWVLFKNYVLTTTSIDNIKTTSTYTLSLQNYAISWPCKIQFRCANVQVSIRRSCRLRRTTLLINNVCGWINLTLENHRENKTHPSNTWFHSWFVIDTTFSKRVITFYICPMNEEYEWHSGNCIQALLTSMHWTRIQALV